MLQPAILHEEELRLKFLKVDYDEHYRFFQAVSHRKVYEATYETWNQIEYASVDSDNNVVGYISYHIDRDVMSAHRLQAIQFSSDHKMSRTFIVDLYQALYDALFKLSLTKLSFSVVVGNPVEKSYDRIVQELGGRIVGTMRNEARLCDGKIYDMKFYELLPDEFRTSLFHDVKLQRRFNKLIGASNVLKCITIENSGRQRDANKRLTDIQNTLRDMHA